MPTAHRGEVWQVDLGLAAKVRPALVVSIPFLDNERALYAIIPHTTAPRGTRFEVGLTVSGLEAGVVTFKDFAVSRQTCWCAAVLH